MPIYIRFENNKQQRLKAQPAGNDWHEAPRNFDWQKSYCLTEGGEIVERTKEDIQKELLDNAKLCSFDSMRFYYDNHTHQYAGHSHQNLNLMRSKRKLQKAFLAAPESISKKDTEIIEPLAIELLR